MKNIRYVLMVLLGGIMYGTMSSFVKMSYAEGYTAAQLSFWQAMLAFFFLAGCSFASRGKGQSISKTDVVPLLLTGSAIGLTNFLYYLSVAYIPASLAIILLMQFTWLDLLIERIAFNRKASAAELSAVAVIMVGTVMASGILSAGLENLPVIGIALALGASLTYSAYIVANGRCGRNVRWQSKSMAIMGGSALTILAANGGSQLSPDYINFDFLLWGLFLAVIGTTIPTALFAAGIPKVGAGLSAILMTVELPVAVICAHFVLGENLSAIQIGGVVIMLSAISSMNYYKFKNNKKQCSTSVK